SQIWQWVHHSATLSSGEQVTPELVRRIADEELEKIRTAVGDEADTGGRFKEAREIFETVALSDDFAEFLTVPAYEYLD
ncbi:MAG: hypothetical protein ACR2J0_10610, partial [Mycobacteriales bacterium]